MRGARRDGRARTHRGASSSAATTSISRSAAGGRTAASFPAVGSRPDYHRAGDRPERINYEKMETIARMVHQMSWNLAQQDSRPGLNRDLE